MSKIAHLRSVGATTQRSPARAKLAVAIERHAKVQRRIEEIETARSRLLERRTAAIRAENDTAAAIEKTKENAAAFALATALGTAGECPQSLKEANAAHAAALEEGAVLTDGAVSLRTMANDLEGDLRFAVNRMGDATNAVIADECGAIAQRLAAEYEQIASDWANRHNALDWLSDHGAFGDGVKWQPTRAWPNSTGAKNWQALADALKSDPNAPLPTI
jgi:hypothetical protein